MSKLYKFLIIFILLSTLCFQIVQATSLDDTEEELDSTSVENIVDDTEEDTANVEENTMTTRSSANTSTNSTTTPSTTSNNSGVTSVTQVSDYSEANLGLNNILNIILIAIGVLIILFSIAILIRLK